MTVSHELIQGSGLGELTHGVRTPEEILKEAGKRALALNEVVKRNGFSQKIGKAEHIKVEGWITCGQFYGCTAKIKETEYVELGDVVGFKAKAQLIHDQTGQILSEAEAYCMRDEERWRARPRYKYVNGEPIVDGEDPVPLSQVASMAQTRATSKVLAMKFRWIVVLAGYAETPAEEMVGNEQAHEEANKAKEQKPSTARRIAYGEHKGKELSDETVPANYLGWMLKTTKENLGKGKRKPYIKQDEEWIELLDAELKRRREEKGGEKEDGEPTDKQDEPKDTRKPMDDEPWVDFCEMCRQESQGFYDKVADEMGIGNPMKLEKGLRNEFQDKFKALKAGAK